MISWLAPTWSGSYCIRLRTTEHTQSLGFYFVRSLLLIGICSPHWVLGSGPSKFTCCYASVNTSLPDGEQCIGKLHHRSAQVAQAASFLRDGVRA